MIGSTFFLAGGTAFLITARLSGSPGTLGLVVFVGVALVAIACALHLTALLGRSRFPAIARFGLVAACWVLLALGMVWVIERAPRIEVLVALMVVPPLVGFAGLLAPRPNRWAAIAFLALSVLLTVVLAPVWLERHV